MKDPEPGHPTEAESPAKPSGHSEIPDLARVRFGLLSRHRWAIFVLPFVVYMLFTYIEPRPAWEPPTAEAAGPEGDSTTTVSRGYRGYTLWWAARVSVTTAVIVFVLPGYREFPLRVSPLAVVVGAAGVVAWIVICWLDLESKILEPMGLHWFLGTGARAAFDPLTHFGDRRGALLTFLAVRFLGLAVVVPVIEEFFLRGFVMRFVVAQEWWRVPIGQAGTVVVVTGIVYGVLSHPAEMFAAAVWFTLVTWLMIKTGNLWDCVAAHAVTNLLLGVYVLTWHDWSLW